MKVGDTITWHTKTDKIIMKKRWIKLSLAEVLFKLTSIIYRGDFDLVEDQVYYNEVCSIYENLIAESYKGLCESHYLYDDELHRELSVEEATIALNGLLDIFKECPKGVDQEAQDELQTFIRGYEVWIRNQTTTWLVSEECPLESTYGFWKITY